MHVQGLDPKIVAAVFPIGSSALLLPATSLRAGGHWYKSRGRMDAEEKKANQHLTEETVLLAREAVRLGVVGKTAESEATLELLRESVERLAFSGVASCAAMAIRLQRLRNKS